MLEEIEIVIALSTILRCCTALGWIFRGSAYCQLIRDANKTKRLAFAQTYKDDEFNDVIWTDECTVQLENHRRFAVGKDRHQNPNQGKNTHTTCTRMSINDRFLYM